MGADRPQAAPHVVLREESDDWAILFDPDTGAAFGVDPVGVLIWKHLDGTRAAADIVRGIRAVCPDAPPEVDQHVDAFLVELGRRGLLLGPPPVAG